MSNPLGLLFICSCGIVRSNITVGNGGEAEIVARPGKPGRSVGCEKMDRPNKPGKTLDWVVDISATHDITLAMGIPGEGNLWLCFCS